MTFRIRFGWRFLDARFRGFGRLAPVDDRPWDTS